MLLFTKLSLDMAQRQKYEGAQLQSNNSLGI